MIVDHFDELLRTPGDVSIYSKHVDKFFAAFDLQLEIH